MAETKIENKYFVFPKSSQIVKYISKLLLQYLQIILKFFFAVSWSEIILIEKKGMEVAVLDSRLES